MPWNHAIWKKLAICLMLASGLAACGTDTASPNPAEPYAFTIEKDMLAMKDGVPLAVTYYRPLARTPGETFPVIMEKVPYRKDDFFTLGDYQYGSYFAKRGYVVARVDVRGTGSSGGRIPDREYSEAEISDAEELIAQLAQKSWSNGKVGMYGISWSAFNALMTAHRKPPALKAIIGAHGSTDLFYNDVHYIDGAMHIDSYAHQIDTDNALPQSPDYRIDDAYFQNRFDREPWIFTWLREQQDGDFWRQQSIKFKEPLEVPAYLIGGLLDGYRDFATDVIHNSKAPVIAEIGSWNHAWPEYGSPGPNYEWREKALRWWDYWLKGIDNGVLEESRQRMAFMRTGHPPSPDQTMTPGYWRCDRQWPVDGASTRRLYPQTGRQLSDALTAQDGSDSLRYRAGIGMAAGGWWGEPTGNMAADDTYSLVYDSAPLTDAVEIMGMPQVRLRVAADAPFYQWTVRLEDVAPDGQVALVSGAAINPSQRNGRLQPTALIPGEPTTLTASIHFTTWRFQPGHRIRLAVANAQFPMIWPSPTPGTTSLFPGADTWVDLPVVPTQNETSPSCQLPEPQASDKAPFGQELPGYGPTFEYSRDPETGDSTFTSSAAVNWEQDNNTYHSTEHYRWNVNDATPANASFHGERRNVFTISGREIDLATRSVIESDAEYFHITFTKTLRQNGVVVRERTWRDDILRRYQ